MKIHGGKLEVGEAEVGVDMMTLKYCLTLALESTSWRGVLGDGRCTNTRLLSRYIARILGSCRL